MAEDGNYRSELKYLCSAVQLAIIRGRMQAMMRPDSHTVNGQYTIRSMYFDNCDDRCFYENESGTDPREKFRIRIYNADGARISLECKRKERSKTHKTACLLSPEEYRALLAGETAAALASEKALLRKFALLMRTELFRPAVIVEYDRTPFIWPVGNVRITLDRNIRSSVDFDRFFEKDLATRPILPPGQHLLEVKYDALLPDPIYDALQLRDLQQTAFSKYYLCRKYIWGGLS